VTAVQMASLNAAEYFGVAGDLGSIAPGKMADIVMVNDLTEKPSEEHRFTREEVDAILHGNAARVLGI